IRHPLVTGVQTCALPIWRLRARWRAQLCEVRRAEGNRRDCDANQCDGDGNQAKRSDAHPVPPVAKPAKNAQSIRELLDGRRTSADRKSTRLNSSHEWIPY